MSTENQNRLCSTCRAFFDSKSILKLRDEVMPEGQSLEKFLTAVEQNCPICYTLWNQSEKYREAWTNLEPDKWKPTGYSVSFKTGPDEASIPLWMEIWVRHRDPVKNRWWGLGFHLIHPTDEDFPALVAPPATFEESTGSPKSLDQAYAWYQDCLSCHDCNKNCEKLHMQTPGWLPTRLVDVGVDGDLNWKVRNTSSAEFSSPTPQYLTLSYRWGTDPSLLLSSTTMPEFYEGQPIADLPQTFKDLVVVARHFKIRYIWIDCLCIIQDSQKDWHNEAWTMRDVYANSACNIAASASKNPNGGLFRTRDPDRVHANMIQTTIASTEPQEYCVTISEYWEYLFHGRDLHDRGWVFQEYFLAPRLLYFADHQLMWQCFEKQKCEAFPNGTSRQSFSKNLEHLLNISAEEGLRPGQMSIHTAELWMDLVGSYSRCRFTRPSDKLPAFDGIARIFQEVSGDEYIAGMWKSRILDLLDWQVYKPTSRPADINRAPSWSWASVDGLIRHFRPYLHVPGTLLALLEVSQYLPDPYAEGWTPAFLRLRGAVVSATYEEAEDARGESKISMNGKVPPFGFRPSPDCKETTFKGSGEVCFLVSSWTTVFRAPLDSDSSEGIPYKRVACIILEPVEGYGDRYRRIGHLEIGEVEEIPEETANYFISLRETDSREIMLV